MNLKDKIDQRASVWSQMQEIRDAVAKDDWTDELRASWDKADADLVRLTGDIEREERESKLDGQFKEIDERTTVITPDGAPAERDQEEQYRSAFVKFLRFGQGDLDQEERSLLHANFRSAADDPAVRALGTTSGAVGGYTVPTAFWAKVTETMKFYGGAIEGAEQINTDAGNAINWPTNDDTANVGYILGENTAATNEGDLVFGQKALGAYTFVSGPGLISLQLIQDSGIDIEGIVARKMGERLGRIQNTRFTTGTGTAQPQGHIVGATTGKTTASATAITYNEIVDLIHSVDAAYRATGRCRFKMHDLVLAYVRKLRDDSGGAGLGRPLWEPSIQVGVPDSLLSYPVTVNNDMASAVTTGLKTMTFGDPQAAFVVRRVSGGQMMRLAERYAEFLQVGFLAYERADSVVQDASACKNLVQL